jgi:hypothetical protein
MNILSKNKHFNIVALLLFRIVSDCAAQWTIHDKFAAHLQNGLS